MVLHFQEKGRINPVAAGDRMMADAYGMALDHLVITCVDLVLTYQNRVLLTQRQRPPRASWWLIGGRMMAGEAPTEAALRKASEEANLQDLTADRLRYVGAYSTCFATRHQPPQHHGLHSLNLTYQLELTEAEQGAIVLIPEEYSDWRWVEVTQVAAILAEDVSSDAAIDQALLRVIQDLDHLF
ncbi:MAG: NUDIX hydrolase [Oscillatoriophycideae cyanobacterium NC_groundwater_1537_Pr4_S-0.65um_50_18]|nr:NUDIX hydrolase [Oscillatoriophycideae cyanobacterium NC_groundwater_1537_Pr4_S-0.65um_50_18]